MTTVPRTVLLDRDTESVVDAVVSASRARRHGRSLTRRCRRGSHAHAISEPRGARLPRPAIARCFGGVSGRDGTDCISDGGSSRPQRPCPTTNRPERPSPDASRTDRSRTSPRSGRDRTSAARDQRAPELDTTRCPGGHGRRARSFGSCGWRGPRPGLEHRVGSMNEADEALPQSVPHPIGSVRTRALTARIRQWLVAAS